MCFLVKEIGADLT